MTDRLDRTILEFVDTGQITPEVAQELSRELHHPPIDVKQRLAELAGYVGAGLAVLGVVVIASQVWSDFGQVLQALVPAVLSAGLLLGTYLVVHAVPHISEHPVRGRIAQVMGVASAVFALLATAVAFDPAPGETFRWQMFIAMLVGLAVTLVVAHWSPGFIASAAVAILLFFAGLSFIDGLGIWEEEEFGIAFSLWMLVLGAIAALVLHRFLPPAWLMRAAGVGLWLMGSWVLMIMSHEPGFDLANWVWVGRAAAVALVVAGTWFFVRGGDWPWAAGAALAMAILVGMWSAEAINAGVALVVAGLALIAVGVALAAWRRGVHHDAPVEHAGPG